MEEDGRRGEEEEGRGGRGVEFGMQKEEQKQIEGWLR